MSLCGEFVWAHIHERNYSIRPNRMHASKLHSQHFTYKLLACKYTISTAKRKSLSLIPMPNFTIFVYFFLCYRGNVHFSLISTTQIDDASKNIFFGLCLCVLAWVYESKSIHCYIPLILPHTPLRMLSLFSPRYKHYPFVQFVPPRSVIPLCFGVFELQPTTARRSIQCFLQVLIYKYHGMSILKIHYIFVFLLPRFENIKDEPTHTKKDKKQNKEKRIHHCK